MSLFSCILVIWKFFLLCNGINPHPYSTPPLTVPGLQLRYLDAAEIPGLKSSPCSFSGKDTFISGG